MQPLFNYNLIRNFILINTLLIRLILYMKINISIKVLSRKIKKLSSHVLNDLRVYNKNTVLKLSDYLYPNKIE